MVAVAKQDTHVGSAALGGPLRAGERALAIHCHHHALHRPGPAHGIPRGVRHQPPDLGRPAQALVPRAHTWQLAAVMPGASP